MPVKSARKPHARGLLASFRVVPLLTLPFISPALAADIPEEAGTAEFQYLENLIFARPAGIAGAYTSLAGAEDAIGYNPAGLSKLEGARSFSGTFRYHFLDVASGNATYAFPGFSGSTFAFSAAYLNSGRIPEVDDSGVESGKDIIPASFNPSLTAAVRWGQRVRAGATLKGLTEYLGDFEGSTLAVGWGADLGLQYQPNAKNLGFGLALLNLGRKERPHFAGGSVGGALPASLKGGMFYHPLDLPKGKVAVDLELPWHDSPMLSGGLEYALSQAFQLRAGSRVTFAEVRHYFLKATDQRPGYFEGGNALKLASGFTFQAEGIAVDYAVQYWLNLSWVHALTFRYAVI